MSTIEPRNRPGRTASHPTNDRARERALSVLVVGKSGQDGPPGGGEIQMHATARALSAMGVSARIESPTEEAVARADCVHLFGSLPEHLPVIELARRSGVPLVLSTIAWFELACVLGEPRPMLRRLAAGARFVARAALPRLPSWRRRVYHAVDLLLPNSKAEAQQLMRYFEVPANRIQIVPNGADLRFAQADPEPFAEQVGMRDFVLCAGRIEPRKNQLGLIRALQSTEVPIVVLGDVVPGYEWYLSACHRAARKHVRFVPGIDHEDPLLASAYAACNCLALVSWFETPGLVALEAGMSGTPLVLPEHGCASEYFGPLAEYVRPSDLPGIRRAVLAAWQRGRSRSLGELVRENFTWTAAAAITREAYGRARERGSPCRRPSRLAADGTSA